MQSGKLVEHADTNTVFESPQQEYTRTLLNAIPGSRLSLSTGA
jgi:peptide/nickel transport system ATP-binding protein